MQYLWWTYIDSKEAFRYSLFLFTTCIMEKKWCEGISTLDYISSHNQVWCKWDFAHMIYTLCLFPMIEWIIWFDLLWQFDRTIIRGQESRRIRAMQVHHYRLERVGITVKLWRLSDISLVSSDQMLKNLKLKR